MRVLLSGDSFPPKLDGVQNFARNTIQALVRDGHKVHVFCSNGSPSTHLAPENYGATVTRGPGVEVQPKHKMLALKMDVVLLLLFFFFFFLVLFIYLFGFCPYGCPFWLETVGDHSGCSAQLQKQYEESLHSCLLLHLYMHVYQAYKL